MYTQKTISSHIGYVSLVKKSSEVFGSHTRTQVWFFKVYATWVHLPGTQGRDPGSGQTFFFFQNTPPRPRNLPRVPTGYLDTRKVHRGQFWFLKVDRTFACLPGSQGREPGSGQSFFFLKIDHLDLGTCHGTEQGTWTHGRFTGNKFDFSKLTGPGCIYQDYREEILAPDTFFSKLTN